MDHLELMHCNSCRYKVKRFCVVSSYEKKVKRGNCKNCDKHHCCSICNVHNYTQKSYRKQPTTTNKSYSIIKSKLTKSLIMVKLLVFMLSNCHRTSKKPFGWMLQLSCYNLSLSKHFKAIPISYTAQIRLQRFKPKLCSYLAISIIVGYLYKKNIPNQVDIM